MAQPRQPATIIYNSNAGQTKTMPLADIQAGLAELGYEPIHAQTESADDLDGALKGVTGLVVAVGGDGTIRAVATKLANRPEVELAFLTAGTANNIAKSLKVNMPWREALASLATPRRLGLDLGRVKGPLGEELFVEAFGCGLYADTLAEYEPEQGKSKLRALNVLTDLLPNFQPYEDWQVLIDGAPVAGKYLLLEALNICMVGPNMNLAPDADPSDGLLDVVTIFESNRTNFMEHIQKMRAGELHDLENVELRRAKKIEIVWTGFPYHLDDTPKFEIEKPEQAETPKRVSPELKPEKEAVLAVDVLHHAVKLLLPPAQEVAV
jgi:diacylglycerol kinase (ATP)